MKRQAPAPRDPWQLFWSRLLAARRGWYASRAKRLPLPVLSVGNLHLGGSGKTPIVAALARHLRDHGRQVAILSRGYRRSTQGTLIASRGDGLLASAREVGDEPAALAAELPGVAVVVGEDRHRAGLCCLDLLDPPPDLFVLDDGFSHLGLARDLDLLTFPAASPWGNGRLAPFGPLREPLQSVRHADAVVLTGLDAIADQGERLARALRRYGFDGPGFGATLRASCAPCPAPGTPVLLVTGVARPEQVLATACRLGLRVVEHLRFPDHHAYPARSLKRIERARSRYRTPAVAVTSKDRIKLGGRLGGSVLELEVRAEPEEEFWSWLDHSSPISNRRSPPSTD